MQRRTAIRLAGLGAVGSATLYGASRLVDRRQTRADDAYEPLGSVTIEGTTDAVASDDGSVAYVATTTGYATVDLADPTDPTVLADIREPLADHPEGPLREIYDLKVSGDRLLVVGPANDNTPGPRAALVVDVADPAEPTQLGVFETDYHLHNCFVDGEYAYLCGNDFERNPLVILDISDPTEPQEIARWSLLDVDDEWEPVDPLLRYLHDVWVRDGLAVLPYWDAGTWLVDVSDPTDPTFLSQFGQYEPEELVGLSSTEVRAEQRALPGNDHYAATDPTNSLLALGREGWVVERDGTQRGGPGGIELYDISDPVDPQQVAAIDPPETPDPTIGGIWTTAHNFELSTDRLYSSWYQGGMMIHDISDPSNPERIAAWRDPEAVSFWTAQRAGDRVIASSMGQRNATPSLWVFPDRAGQQVDRPPLE